MGKVGHAFRQHNDCVARHLDTNVQASLHSDNLPLSTIRKFARRTRDHLRAYMSPDESTASHSLVEKLRRVFKCHRGSIDFDFHLISDA